MLGQVFGRVDRRDDERGFDNMSDRPINKWMAIVTVEGKINANSKSFVWMVF
jgi:hypothetical protein